jgi:hypothetical protein
LRVWRRLVPELAIFSATFFCDPCDRGLALLQGLVQLTGYTQSRGVWRLREGRFVRFRIRSFGFEKVEERHGRSWIE